ncbi:hypothetical protein EIN_226180 [Entamoeba invadens IP1]|uniref:Maelstrom domain-containing protein n=1 Tax=Entamoeba invadens IP1 TaxID=370355 RepID=A0A0A1U5V8_ENTIV|nr:hypothetical protein EIN_226180 [Entamoeba invadens IP1]ELP88255.1 hypothetical protein EIN_226180 [Entamoeba invadens IP1]|eukprot:XP_004255026.1 hypothetical protein EIN_226180 [Entamoeba invadens IP1]
MACHWEPIITQYYKTLGDQAKNQPVFVIDFQYCYTTQFSTVPIEFSIAALRPNNPSESLDPYTKILRPEVPDNYKLRAKQHAKTEHQIDDITNPEKETDFVMVWKMMNKYINDLTSSVFQPVVVCKGFSRAMQCVEYISRQANVSGNELAESAFRVMFPLDEFVQTMLSLKRVVIDQNYLSRVVKPMLTLNPNEEYRCSFHAEQKNILYGCSKANSLYFVQFLTDLNIPECVSKIAL